MRDEDGALVRVLGVLRALEGTQADNEVKAKGQSTCEVE